MDGLAEITIYIYTYNIYTVCRSHVIFAVSNYYLYNHHLYIHISKRIYHVNKSKIPVISQSCIDWLNQYKFAYIHLNAFIHICGVRPFRHYHFTIYWLEKKMWLIELKTKTTKFHLFEIFLLWSLQQRHYSAGELDEKSNHSQIYKSFNKLTLFSPLKKPNSFNLYFLM